MKIVALFFVLVATSLSGAEKIGVILRADDRNTYMLEEALIEMLECFKVALRRGIPNLNLPHFSPLHLGNINLDLDQNLIKGKFTGFDVTLGGIPEFEIEKLEIGDRVEFSLFFNVTLSSEYEFEGDLAELKGVRGNGHLDFNNAFELDADFRLVIGSPSGVEDVEAKLRVEPKITLTGLQADTDVSTKVSERINLELEKFFVENSDVIDRVISERVREILNALLQIEVNPEIADFLSEVISVCNEE